MEHAKEMERALKALVEAFVSPAVEDYEIPTLLSGLPGCGNIIPAVIAARAALRRRAD